MNPLVQTTRRQSSVHALLGSGGPIWTVFGDMAAVLRFQDPASEVRLREQLALCDMSCFARMSVKGPVAVQRMTELAFRSHRSYTSIASRKTVDWWFASTHRKSFWKTGQTHGSLN